MGFCGWQYSIVVPLLLNSYEAWGGSINNNKDYSPDHTIFRNCIIITNKPCSYKNSLNDLNVYICMLQKNQQAH